MNKVMTGFWMILALSTSASAADTLSAKLTRFNLDPSWTTAANVDGGGIAVDLATKNVTLRLVTPSNCPKGAFCFVSMPQIITVELPLTDVATDSCGSVTYTARKDLRLVDGALEQLTVTDNTPNRCETLAALPATSVAYKTNYFNRQNGKDETRLSTFVGERLTNAQ